MKGFLLLALLTPILACAQTPEILKLADEISKEDLKTSVYKFASPEMEGSFTGTRGDTLAAEYIASWFKKNKLQAPYNNGASFFQSVPLEKILITKSSISASDKNFQQFNDWYMFPGSIDKSVKLNTLPIVFGGYGLVSDQYNDLVGVDMQGKVVVILQAQPADKIEVLLSTATRTSISSDYMKNLAERGAAAVLVVTNDFERSSRALKISGTLRSYRNPEPGPNPLPRIYVSERMINELLQQNDVSIQSLMINMRRSHRPLPFITKTTIGIDIQIDSVKEHAPNVIGMINGKDTSSEVVIISAHHDHLGKRSGQVFNGASDNASSGAALMEIARLMQKAALSGTRPKRTIIFASFTGEEIGSLGASYYLSHPAYPVNRVLAAFNLGAMGSADSAHSGKANSNYTYFLVRDTLRHGLISAMVSANETTGLKLDDRYQEPEFPNRWLSGSDAFPSYSRGISIIQTGSGYVKTYHQLTDTPDKIDFSLLALQTKQAFLTLWNIANKD